MDGLRTVESVLEEVQRFLNIVKQLKEVMSKETEE